MNVVEEECLWFREISRNVNNLLTMLSLSVYLFIRFFYTALCCCLFTFEFFFYNHVVAIFLFIRCLCKQVHCFGFGAFVDHFKNTISILVIIPLWSCLNLTLRTRIVTYSFSEYAYSYQNYVIYTALPVRLRTRTFIFLYYLPRSIYLFWSFGSKLKLGTQIFIFKLSQTVSTRVYRQLNCTLELWTFQYLLFRFIRIPRNEGLIKLN